MRPWSNLFKNFVTATVGGLLLLFSNPALCQTPWENPPRQLPANVQEWLDLEMLANPVTPSERIRKPLRLEHIEIPLKLLGRDFVIEDRGLGLRKEIEESLVFERTAKNLCDGFLIPRTPNINKKSSIILPPKPERFRQSITALSVI